jgi:hypothetical protein
LRKTISHHIKGGFIIDFGFFFPDFCNQDEIFLLAMPHRETIINTLGKNNNSVWKSPDGKSLNTYFLIADILIAS